MKGRKQRIQPHSPHSAVPPHQSDMLGSPESQFFSQAHHHNSHHAPGYSGYADYCSSYVPQHSSPPLRSQFPKGDLSVPGSRLTADDLVCRATCEGRGMNIKDVPNSVCVTMARRIDTLENAALSSPSSAPLSEVLFLTDEPTGFKRRYRIETTISGGDPYNRIPPMLYTRVQELDLPGGEGHSVRWKSDASARSTEAGGVSTRHRPWGRYALYAGGAAVASAGLLIGLGALAANPDFDATKAATSIYGATSEAASNLLSWAYPKAEAIGASAISAGSHAKSAASSGAHLLGRGLGNAWNTLGSMTSAVKARSAAWVEDQIAKENEDKTGLKRFFQRAMESGTGVLSGHAGRYWKGDTQLDPSEQLGVESGWDASQEADDVEVSQE